MRHMQGFLAMTDGKRITGEWAADDPAAGVMVSALLRRAARFSIPGQEPPFACCAGRIS